MKQIYSIVLFLVVFFSACGQSQSLKEEKMKTALVEKYVEKTVPLALGFFNFLFYLPSICLMYLLVCKTRFKVMYIYILTSLLSVVLCLLEARLKKEIVVILSCSLVTVLLVCVLFKRIFGKIYKCIT